MNDGNKLTLKELRKRAGMTQQQAAAEFGVSVDTIKRWEDGKTQPTVSQIYKIEKAYKAPFRDILFVIL